MTKDKHSNLKLQHDFSEIHHEYGNFYYPDDNVMVISQPSFEGIYETLEYSSVENAKIITPELALLNDEELSGLTREKFSLQLIADITRRFSQIKSLAQARNNTVMVGMPAIAESFRAYSNGLTTVSSGGKTYRQVKSNPGSYEQGTGVFEYPAKLDVFHDLGATAIICSDLLYAVDLDPHIKLKTEKILLAAAWGVPPDDLGSIEKYGSIDDYNTLSLDAAVTSAAGDLPNLKKIYIADRKVGDGAPQSGKITIRR